MIINLERTPVATTFSDAETFVVNVALATTVASVDAEAVARTTMFAEAVTVELTDADADTDAHAHTRKHTIR